MRLVGYLEDGVRRIGAVHGEEVTPLGTVEEFYRGGQSAAGGEPLSLSGLEQVPFVPETARVFCVGLRREGGRRAGRRR